MATPARIGYQTFTFDAVAIASSQEEGFEADSVTNPLTYEKWKPTSASANIVIDLLAVKNLNYIALGAHDFGSTNKTVQVHISVNGTSYNLIDTLTPSDDKAIMLTFGNSNARFVRITLSGGSIPTLGVIYAGLYLEMYRPFYAGHVPGVLSRNTTIKPNKSVGGQWLGRSVERQGLGTRYSWKNTPLQWYEDNIEPFSVHAQTYPFFVQWSPEEHPEHVVYCWTEDDIKPTLSGTRDLVEFGFSVEGIE